MQSQTQDTLKLAGREFVGVGQNLSAAQDDYLLGHLRAAGVLEIMGDHPGKRKRSQAKRGEEILTAIMLSGRKQQILAGLLTEPGKKWSREDADDNAEAFGEITDATEKLLMRTALVTFVLGFFMSGEPSATTSPKSSSPGGTDHGTANAGPATSVSLH